ncbi:MAG: Lrp/AsnC family transcriptional regulator [Candidatus Hodarchaeota archaeon]
MVVDELNKKIVEILRKNGRTSFTHIAEEISVSEATVRKRIKVLEEKKVILGYTVVLDPLKLGYNVVAMVGLDVDPRKFFFVSEKIKELDEVKWVATSTGEHMLLMEVWAEDGQRLSRILTEKIGKIDGVQKVHSSLILEKQKSF